MNYIHPDLLAGPFRLKHRLAMGPSPLTLTKAARKHIEDTALAHGVEHVALRVRLVSETVEDGFDLALERDPLPDDRVFSDRGIRFHIAPEVLPHVEGLVVDFRHGGARTGFVFRRGG